MSAELWAVGGSSPEVGTSVVSVALALGLARLGNTVVLIDADPMGGAMGSVFKAGEPKYTLSDLMAGRVSGGAREALIPTRYEQLCLMDGVIGPRAAEDPAFIEKFARALASIEAENIVVELGPEHSTANMDIFNLASSGILVTGPSQEALLDAYDYAKQAVRRRLFKAFENDPEVQEQLTFILEGSDLDGEGSGFRERIAELGSGRDKIIMDALEGCACGLIVNRDHDGSGQIRARAMIGTARKFLGLEISLLGGIGELPELASGPQDYSSHVFAPGAELTQRAVAIIDGYLSKSQLVETKPDVPRDFPMPSMVRQYKDTSRLQMGYNDDISHGGRIVHVQTEDLGEDKREILTLVYSEGSILFSRSTSYDEHDIKDGEVMSIRDRVQWQHRVVMAGIQSGKLDDKLGTTKG